MALALNQQNHGFKPPSGWNRHCRLSSLDQIFQLNKSADLTSSKTSHRSPLLPKSLSTPCLLDCLPKSKSSATIPNVKSNPSLNTYPKQQKKVSACVKLTGSNKTVGINELVAETAVAITLGPDPVRGKGENSNSFYPIGHDNEKIAIIKPADIQSAAREAAAYLLDHEGFSGVPPTTVIRISHPVIHKTSTVTASVQRFVPNISDSSEMGPSMFVTEKVHRIGILDIRLYNIDRHTGNMLVKMRRHNTADPMKNFDLVPIDHELCLPEKLDIPYFEWLHWPCALISFSPFKLNYIASLDPFKDAKMLRSELPQISEASIRIMVLSTIFLKKAVSAGLCLADIGKMMTPINDTPSALEILCRRAAALVFIEKSTDQAFSILDWEDGEGEPEMDKRDAAKLSKFVSFPKRGLSLKMVTFKFLSEKEWMRFLEKFEGLLPLAFETRNSVGLEKNPLTKSCKF